MADRKMGPLERVALTDASELFEREDGEDAFVTGWNASAEYHKVDAATERLAALRSALAPLAPTGPYDSWTHPQFSHARRCRVSTNMDNGRVTIHACVCGIGALLAFLAGKEDNGE